MLKKYKWIKILLSSLIVGLFSYLWLNLLDFSLAINPVNTTTNQNNKPNIIVIVADDLGWNDVEYHGSEIKTPNLDQLASSSVVLDKFYVKSICSPTRAALMTGRHPFRYGMSSNIVWPWEKNGLPLDEKTIAETLKEVGYYTAIVGKWHLGQYKEEQLPTRRGFNYHYGHYCGQLDYFNHTLLGGLDWHRNEKALEEKGYSTDLLTQEAVKLIQENKYSESPLFLYVAFNAPHDPLQAKTEDIFNYKNIQEEGRRIYAAQVQSMDEGIGKIVQALKDKKVWDNTLLVFTSDNGGAANLPTTRSDNRPLRGEKGTLYEGGIRVPAIISYPAKFKESQINQQLFSVVDLYPTFAEIAEANLKSQKPVDGIDILQAITTGSTGRDKLLLEYQTSTAAMIKGDYKLIKNSNYFFGLEPYYGTTELFNLKNDPLENYNLVYAEPEKVKEIQKILDAYVKDIKPSILTATEKMPENFVVPKIWNPEFIQNSEKTDSKSFLDKLKTSFNWLIILFSFLGGFLIGCLSIFILKSKKLKQASS